MTSLVRRFVPRWMRATLVVPYRQLTVRARRAQLERAACRSPLKIVVGAGGQSRPDGWVPTDEDVLNLLEVADWEKYFSPSSVDAILAEHVWEHLTAEEGRLAARNCFRYLRMGGHLRIAVPDGLHPDPNYVEQVRPGGTGDGAQDHKVLYDYRSLIPVFTGVGFQVRLLEYFDEARAFHFEPWDPSQGMVHRSSRFDSRNVAGALAYTSLIIDAVKAPDAEASRRRRANDA